MYYLYIIKICAKETKKNNNNNDKVKMHIYIII